MYLWLSRVVGKWLYKFFLILRDLKLGVGGGGLNFCAECDVTQEESCDKPDGAW